MSKDYSKKALFNFLNLAIERGLFNTTTARSYRSACLQVLEVADESESGDLSQLDMDSVFNRFCNLNKAKFKPESLATYKSRFTSAVREFIRWEDNPSSFRPKRSSGPKPTLESNGKAEKHKKGNTLAIETITKEGQQDPVNIDSKSLPSYFIPIRPNILIEIKGLPFDLSRSEAEKIAAVLTALSLSN